MIRILLRHNEVSDMAAAKVSRVGTSDFSVLVVDDEQFIRQVLVRIIRRDGYTVAEATNGQDALTKMSEMVFDLVITDFRMPEMDGMTLLSRLKEQYPSTQVVMITGYSNRDSERKAREAGADQFITKPFKNTEISRSLAQLVARRTRS